jgi:hypothetical protein
VDRPAALRIAQENAARARLGTRYQNIAGDFMTASFGMYFDAALLTARLFQLEPSQIEALLQRIRDAMKKTARLFILEFFPEDRPEDAGFGLTMLTSTSQGRPYSMVEMKDFLRLSGFGAVETRMLTAAHATLIAAMR